MMRLRMFILLVAVACALALPAFSQSIYVWDKDNNHRFLDPEGAGSVGSEYAIKQCLTACGYSFTTGNNLPVQLGSYDILFIVMGVYC